MKTKGLNRCLIRSPLMGIKDRKPLHSRTHQLMSPFRINFLFIHCGKAYVWNCLLCEARKLLLTEYKHSHNEILRLSHRSIVLLARILLSLFVSSFKIKKKMRGPPSPLPPPFISFSQSKNTEIIERRLQQIAWKCGGGGDKGERKGRGTRSRSERKLKKTSSKGESLQKLMSSLLFLQNRGCGFFFRLSWTFILVLSRVLTFFFKERSLRCWGMVLRG